MAEYKTSYAFPTEAANRFTEATSAMAQMQAQVSEHYLADPEVKLFDITSKIHHLSHSVMLSKFINPRVVWCFTGEDMMKYTQQLAKNCFRGLKPPSASVKIVSHIRHIMNHRFNNVAD